MTPPSGPPRGGVSARADHRGQPRTHRSRHEDAVLVPAYLLVVPLEYSERLAPPRTSRRRDPSLRGNRTPSPPLRHPRRRPNRKGPHTDPRPRPPLSGRAVRPGRRARLFQVEQFDQVVAPAPANGGGGFTPKDLTWILILPRPSRFYDATDSPPFSEPRLATPHRRSSPPRAPSAQTSSPSAMAAQTSSSSARGECRPRGSGSHAPPTRRQALGDVCSRYRRQLSGVFGHVPRGASGPCLGRSRA
jgi:hypothetical protein